MIGLVSIIIHHLSLALLGLLLAPTLTLSQQPMIARIGKKLFEAIAHFPTRCATLCLHACSTVDSDDFAIDPFAILRSQETDDAGDVDGLTHSSDW